ncbi:MAG: glycosyl transferase family 1 [Nocardioides sp.]|nr:glycosyl transferase family 1 [Nocardioides sp.]
MRVLQLTQFFPPVVGGEERHVRNLSLALAERGHDVHVATLDPGSGAAPEDLADRDVTGHVLDHVGVRAPWFYPTADRPLALPVPDPVATRDLGRLLREVRPDVVHAHTWLVNSLVPLPAAHRVPLVHSLHDYGHVCATKRLVRDGEPCAGPSLTACPPCARDHYGAGRGEAIWGAVRAGLPVRRRAVDLFTPVSRYVAEANRLPVDGSRYEVVPNFVPDDLVDHDAPRDPGLPDGDFLFFAGDLTRQKGLGTLLAAYDRLDPGTRPPLVCVGREGDAFDVPDGAVLHHSWPHERVVSAFRYATAAVLPSEWPDPCPTTVLEAMALGAPLVTTDRGGIADMVTDERSALVTPSGDVAALATRLERLLADGDLRARLRAGALEDVVPFTLGRVADRLGALYAETVARVAADG